MHLFSRMAIGQVQPLYKQFLVLTCIVDVKCSVESGAAQMSSEAATQTVSAPVTGRVSMQYPKESVVTTIELWIKHIPYYSIKLPPNKGQL